MIYFVAVSYVQLVSMHNYKKISFALARTPPSNNHRRLTRNVVTAIEGVGGPVHNSGYVFGVKDR